MKIDLLDVAAIILYGAALTLAMFAPEVMFLNYALIFVAGLGLSWHAAHLLHPESTPKDTGYTVEEAMEYLTEDDVVGVTIGNLASTVPVGRHEQNGVVVYGLGVAAASVKKRTELFDVITLLLWAPGIIVHELGHVVGWVFGSFVERYTPWDGVRFTYWGAPILNVVYLVVFTVLGLLVWRDSIGLIGGVVFSWVYVANFYALLCSGHDIFFKDHYNGDIGSWETVKENLSGGEE